MFRNNDALATRAVLFALLLGCLAGLALTACGNERERPIRVGDDDNQGGKTDASCEDGEQNGSETDVDCGGRSCAPCDQGRSCGGDDDCLTGICDRGVCVDAQCVGVDCLAGQSCYRGDCWRGCRVQEACPDAGERCVAGACVPLDCAGVSCEDDEICYQGGCYEACETAQDCDGEGAQCLQNACVTPRCDDGIQSGQETDVDCGGSVCGACDQGQGCLEDADCLQQAGEWSDCEFADGDVCTDQGLQTREVYQLECSVANLCVGEKEVETRECTRPTDGISCGDDELVGTGECLPDTELVDCSAGGTRTVTRRIHECSGGACIAVTREESEPCELNTRGMSCQTSLSCAASARCTAGGACEDITLQPGSCLIDGVCYQDGDTNPARACESCDPTFNQSSWSSADCGTPVTETSNPSLPIPGNTWGGIWDSIDVAWCPTIQEFAVDINITHPDRGHLAAFIHPPDSDIEYFTLHYKGGDGEPNLITTFPNDGNQGEGIGARSNLDRLIGLSGQGEWRMKVVDADPGLTGTFNSWTLNMSCK